MNFLEGARACSDSKYPSGAGSNGYHFQDFLRISFATVPTKHDPSAVLI